MYEVVPLQPNLLNAIRPLFEGFRKVAEEGYGFPGDAIDFKTLQLIVAQNLLGGYVIREYPEDRYIGFMLYQVEQFRAVEIKVIYLQDGTAIKSALSGLMNRFLADILTIPNWDVVSFPMLGSKQYEFINTITWYGFTPVGQALVKFSTQDAINVEIFGKVELPPLPEGYRLIYWDPKYEEGVKDVLFEAFEHQVDALWDPRFRTRKGMDEALDFVKSGAYGTFWPACSSIVLNSDDVPVGSCLFNVVSQQEANIPLIGISSSIRRQKLGPHLLSHTLRGAINQIKHGKLKITQVSATVATENFAAIRMYRHCGFEEESWYPHVYQERTKVMNRRSGQWC